MKKTIISFIVIATCVFATPVLAATTTSMGLVPCNGPECTTCDFFKLGNNILHFFIEFSVIIATLMFAWGGLTMVMSAGESGKVTEAKNMMTSSIVGVVIVLSAWLLVDTVLKLVLEGQTYGMWHDISCEQGGQVTPVGGGQSRTTSGTTLSGTTAQQVSDSEARRFLSDAKITVNKTQNDGTSLEGMNKATIQDIINVKNACNCDVVVTGGTETTGGHNDTATGHTAGYKYDMRPNPQLDAYIMGLESKGVRSDDKAPLYRAPSGTLYAKEGDHWDVQVPS